MSALQNFNVDDLEKVESLSFLLRVEPNGKKPLDFIDENKVSIQQLLQANGALLIRGLRILSSQQFGHVLEKVFDEKLLNYSYRSTPRTELRGNVYTATEYHCDEVIPQHNENAYSNQWAMRIGFLCMIPSAVGGETPIADSREVYRRLPKEIVKKFEEKKVMYVRNYGEIDLPWSEVFQTEDKQEVEQYCLSNNMQCEWLPDNGLRTTQINPATAIHPVTGEKVWFNQAHLFHVTSLNADVRQSLLSVVTEEYLPRNTYYGDGSPIEPEVLKIIRDVYEQCKICFKWQKNDLMLLDNMLYTHGRLPFEGNRKILVGMAQAYSVKGD